MYRKNCNKKTKRMKKIFPIIVMLISVLLATKTVYAQNHEEHRKFVQKISCGVITTAGVANESEVEEEKNVRKLKFETAISPYVGLKTPATEHMVAYVLNNSFVTLHSLLLPRDWDTYLTYSKNFHTKSQYVGLGIEKKFLQFDKKNNAIEFYFFGEAGITHQKGKYSLGILMNTQHVLFKRHGAAE